MDHHTTRKAMRTRLAVDDRRDQILAAGTRLFRRRAWGEISIEDIADEAGVSRALLYHYFLGKRELYLAVLRDANTAFRDAIAPDPALPTDARLRASLAAYVAQVETDPQGYASVMRAGAAADPAEQRLVEETRQLVVDQIAEALGYAEAPPVVAVTLRGWVGFSESAVLEWIRNPSLPRESLVDLLAAALASLVTAALTVPIDLGD